VVHALQEREDVAAFATSEAMIETDLGANMEARAALLVEWAEALHRASACTLQRNIVANDIGDIGARTYLVDIVSSDQASHIRNSRLTGG